MMMGQFQLPEEERTYISEMIYAVLASEYFLQLRTLNYHWNVTGPHFTPLHSLFEAQYNWLRESIDLLAERIRALDFFVSLHYTQLTEASCLSAEDDDVDSAGEMLDNLIVGHEQLLPLLRMGVEKTAELKDYSTSDLLTAILREHEKQLWILRSQRAL